ncbi:putative cystathionine gamma-synthase [Escovopsis weberi]|uniref:Putative cystathionine gamma-synthase n=1 Tax=Escovopsis weberi TaxID=150374 RepID=A0A0M9VV76_ESCWE|nr:putative cystathionine gamma-synthase [Escovopsis weberi]
MAALITTEPGEPVPPAPRHSVTFYFGRELERIEKFGADPGPVVARLKTAYPRMKPHRDIQQLADAILAIAGAQGESCVLFSSLNSARECVEYATAPERDDGNAKKPVPAAQIRIRTFTAKDVIYAVIFPAEYTAVLSGFWLLAGVGVSSRFGETNAKHQHQLPDGLKEVSLDSIQGLDRDRSQFDAAVHQTLRERIVSLLDRAPLAPAAEPRPTAGDVYLFPSGMATIYKPITYLPAHLRGINVLFGMAFTNTVTLLTEFGGLQLFGLGADEQLADLERFLAEKRDQGAKVQAIWTEFPANPVVQTPHIERLRELADEYDTLLVIDDTIGSFANVDVMSKADMLVTSLTKSFNGYADVIAGSAVLNPASRKYAELKALFDKHYTPELYVGEAAALELNSRDYLQRTATLNRNASAVATFLDSCAQDPRSAVKQVCYPPLRPSHDNYRRYMRPATADLEPGYGCLLNVELAHLDATRAFYDRLNVYKGPHIGAPFTLALPYVLGVYQQRLGWAAENGLKPTQIRIAVGLEDTETLLEEFRLAVDAANKASGFGNSIDT